MVEPGKESDLPFNVAAWIILLGAATVLILGTSGGLPNAKWSELLTWGRPLTIPQSRILSSFGGNAQKESEP